MNLRMLVSDTEAAWAAETFRRWRAETDATPMVERVRLGSLRYAVALIQRNRLQDSEIVKLKDSGIDLEKRRKAGRLAYARSKKRRSIMATFA